MSPSDLPPPEPLGHLARGETLFSPARHDHTMPAGTRLGVFAPDGSFLPEFRLQRGNQLSRFEDPPETIEDRLTGDFIYGGVVFPHYGHFLLESLARAWYLREHRRPAILWHSPIGRDEPSPWQAEILDMLGIDAARHRFITRTTAVDRVVLPDAGCIIEQRLHPQLARALGVVPFARHPLAGKRVWLSRSRLPERLARIHGEEEMEAELSAAGWSVVHPETLTVREQLAAMVDAEEISGFEGSAFYTLLLAERVPARITMIRRTGGPPPTSFGLMAAAKGLRLTVRDLPLVDHGSPDRAPRRRLRALTDPAAAARSIMHARDGAPLPSPKVIRPGAITAPARSAEQDGPFRAKLAFIHIPKTAGTSMTRALMAGWPRTRIVATQKQFMAITDEQFREIDLVSGHFRAHQLEDRNLGDFDALTVLRDPFDRLFSSYRFARESILERNAQGDEAMQLATQASFGEWVFSRFGLAQRHSQLWVLGLNQDDRPREVSFDTLLSQAKRRLDRMHVGTVDGLADFVDYLFRSYGKEPVQEVPRTNISARFDPGLTRTERNELDDLLRADYALFDYGRSVMLRP